MDMNTLFLIQAVIDVAVVAAVVVGFVKFRNHCRDYEEFKASVPSRRKVAKN